MYKEFFGFKDEPFGLYPDLRFLFLNPHHQEVLTSAVRAITERRGYILLTGEEGTGKTISLQYLLSTLNPEIKTLFFSHPPRFFQSILGGRPAQIQAAALPNQREDPEGARGIRSWRRRPGGKPGDHSGRRPGLERGIPRGVPGALGSQAGKVSVGFCGAAGVGIPAE
jgi:hypothetical protein